MNLQRINELAEDSGLSSYEGENYEGENNYEDDNYDGYDDDQLDFGGQAVDFATEIATDRVFTCSFVNASGATRKVLLSPSYRPSLAAGNILGAPMKEGTIVDNAGALLTGAGSPYSIDDFVAFFTKNATRVLAIKIQSTNEDQMAQQIVITPKSPFRALESQTVLLSSYTSEYATNNKMVTVRRPFQLDDQNEVSLDIPVGTTTVSFYCGALINNALTLSKKAARAGKHPRVRNARMKIATAK